VNHPVRIRKITRQGRAWKALSQPIKVEHRGAVGCPVLFQLPEHVLLKAGIIRSSTLVAGNAENGRG
jgi:hypothetical protein